MACQWLRCAPLVLLAPARYSTRGRWSLSIARVCVSHPCGCLLPQMTVRDSLAKAMEEEMERDDTVVLIGTKGSTLVPPPSSLSL